MDLTHVSSVRNCMSSPSVMGICRDIPILITVSGEKLSDIAVWDGQARNERMQVCLIQPIIIIIFRTLFSLVAISSVTWSRDCCCTSLCQSRFKMVIFCF